jgi:hypothetical protein
MEIMRKTCPDERARIATVLPHQAVEHDELEVRIFPREPFGGPNDLTDSLPLPEDAAEAENPELVRVRRDSFPFREWMEDLRVDSSGGPKAGDAIFAFDPAADSLRIAEIKIVLTDNVAFFFVTFKDKIKVLPPGSEALELGQDRIFAAEPDVETLLGERGERPDEGLKFKPGRLCAGRMENDELVAAPGEFVPNLQIAPDAAKNLDVGKQGGDSHLGMNVT